MQINLSLDEALSRATTGKGYKRWYAEKFLDGRIDFEEDEL